jgi:hypothetical protein
MARDRFQHSIRDDLLGSDNFLALHGAAAANLNNSDAAGNTGSTNSLSRHRRAVDAPDPYALQKSAVNNRFLMWLVPVVSSTLPQQLQGCQGELAFTPGRACRSL